MKEFLNFIRNAYFFLLFLLLEAISFFLIVRNTEKELPIINSANAVSGYFSEKNAAVINYFSLKSENERLVKENEILHNYLLLYKKEKPIYSAQLQNSGYFFKSAKVVKNTIDKPYNILTINKGKKDGIHENMAVISDDGVVGITALSGKNYTTAVSVLNIKTVISAKVKRTGFFGTVIWDGKDYRYVYLKDIPVYSSLFKGDKIVTGGYSAIFPEGIEIGTVAEFKKNNDSFYDIKVKLSQDFKKLNNVYLVDFNGRKERIKLEDSTLLRFRFNPYK